MVNSDDRSTKKKDPSVIINPGKTLDCSSTHKFFCGSTLQSVNMILGTGGARPKLQDTVVPLEDTNIPNHLHGLSQSIIFPCCPLDVNLAGKSPGMKQVLNEHGLWTYLEG